MLEKMIMGSGISVIICCLGFVILTWAMSDTWYNNHPKVAIFGRGIGATLASFPVIMVMGYGGQTSFLDRPSFVMLQVFNYYCTSSSSPPGCSTLVSKDGRTLIIRSWNTKIPRIIKAFTPGYPSNPEAFILEADYDGHEIREISFSQDLALGHFLAYDYFGNGSFYLLDTPGHAIGHLCGFACTTTNPDTFMLMGGDACHHGGEFRPTQYLPLPISISPNPLSLMSVTSCPGAAFEAIHRQKRAD